jgi:hypothetical protein
VDSSQCGSGRGVVYGQYLFFLFLLLHGEFFLGRLRIYSGLMITSHFQNLLEMLIICSASIIKMMASSD